MTPPESLAFTEDPAANRLLAKDPLALVIGMLLDQQIPMERAFHSPLELQERLGAPLSAHAIAGMDPDDLAVVFAERPALHRFPASMAKRTHALCAHLVAEHDGNPEGLWTDAADAKDLLRRLEALPGFGNAKARIFVGVLGKRLGVTIAGWEGVAADWPSIADVATFDDVATLREQKRLMKEAGKG